tara:strand:- start:98 stop:460 length:363 start_codon:yes stop_codon:yes gene_type:complete
LQFEFAICNATLGEAALDSIERFVASTFTDNNNNENTQIVRPYLSNLCVSPKFRRRGLGKQLCQLCEQIAAENWNYDEIFLHVVEDEDSPSAALKLYQHMGYERLDEDRKFTPGWEGGGG